MTRPMPLACAWAVLLLAGAALAGPVEDRAAFNTNLVRPGIEPEEQLADPPADSGVVKTTYDTELGPMNAYATPVREDGRRRPALIWVEGGFGGIGAWTVDPDNAERENDQTVTAYLQAGGNGEKLVVFAPTFRGTAGNPGRYEMFLGEADDLVAAVAHVAARPDVDPRQIYVGGHSTGGTVALLSAALTDKVAGVLSVGGAPDIVSVTRQGGYGYEPFDTGDLAESRMRSPATYAAAVNVPVLYVEGRDDDVSVENYPSAARRMAAGVRGEQMKVAIVPGHNHFTVLRPLHELTARLLASDAPRLPTPEEVLAAYPPARDDPEGLQLIAQCASALQRGLYQRQPLTMSPAAVARLKELAGEAEPAIPPADAVVFLDFWMSGEGLLWDVSVLDHTPAGCVVTEASGLTVAIPRDAAGAFVDTKVVFNDEDGFELE